MQTIPASYETRRTHCKFVAASLLLTCALSACSDVTAIRQMQAPSHAAVGLSDYRSDRSAARSNGVFTCFSSIQIYDPVGYRYGTVELHFPTAFLARSGATRPYLYRGYDRTGRLVRSSTCMIPATSGAIEFTNHHFRVPGGSRVEVEPQGGNGTAGVMSTDEYLLEPIVATVTPVDNFPTTTDGCSTTGCTGMGGPRGGGGGGGGTWTEGGVSANAYQQGPLVWVGCVAAGIALVSGAVLDYVALEDYFNAIVAYNSVLVMIESGRQEAYPGELADRLRSADQQVTLRRLTLVATTGLTAVALWGIAVACSPTAIVPTP